ncbi:uncharacterized protein LOC123866291 [Maniola jurtina]|uniref:uncharacterized protein LOC123866291 n=1 Tax=Maniola jurtina TaxID=191418 RepID=UPI001E68D732|nr:uncharacterized protein LOC123866291 [Maniola jurtina]
MLELYHAFLNKLSGIGGTVRNTRLTDRHLKPNSVDNMKVKLAVRVFSREVALTVSMRMKTYMDILTIDDYCTIPVNIDDGIFITEIILFINNLFDSLNGCGHSKSGFKNALSGKLQPFSVLE